MPLFINKASEKDGVLIRKFNRRTKNDQHFAHATGRIRVIEDSLLSFESLVLFADKTVPNQELHELLDKASYPKGKNFDERLSLGRQDLSRLILELSRSSSVFSRFLLMGYDYFNAKLILKHLILEAKAMMKKNTLDFNDSFKKNAETHTFEHRDFSNSASADDLSAIPSHLQQSLIQAGLVPVTELWDTALDLLQGSVIPKTIYPELLEAMKTVLNKVAGHPDPSLVDIYLDKALYRHRFLLCHSKKVGTEVDILKDYLSLNADITNLQILLRSKRAEASTEYVLTMLVEGGSVKLSALSDAYKQTGIKVIKEAYRDSMLSSLLDDVSSFSGVKEIQAFGKLSDSLLNQLARKGLKTSYGAEVVFGYWIAKTLELKNLRIMLATRDTGKSFEETKELLREVYR